MSKKYIVLTISVASTIILSILLILIIKGKVHSLPISTTNTTVTALTNLKNSDLYFGTTIYPFRKNQDTQWLLNEAQKLGLRELRVEYSRDRAEKSNNSNIYDSSNYLEPDKDKMNILRNSKFDYIFTLNGKAKDRKGQIQDWPRNANQTINGSLAANGMANFTKWAVENTKDFVKNYELWNEAFNTNFDNDSINKGFGPGGSKENADNYANMILPSAKIIKSIDPNLKVLIDGNYWNPQRSIGNSAVYQELLKTADYGVFHPYSYNQAAYTNLTDQTLIGTVQSYEKKINSKFNFWYTEYNVGPKSIGLTSDTYTEDIQAKVVLRSTVFHLQHNINHLDIFDMFYPSKPQYTLIDENKREKLAYSAMQKMINIIMTNKNSINNDKLIRISSLNSKFNDLAISNNQGFTYLIWQNTDSSNLSKNTQKESTKVKLKAGSNIKINKVTITDPITGEIINNTLATSGELTELTLNVPDYPLIVSLG